MVSEIEYQEARENPKLRGHLVRRLELEDKSRYIAKVTYAPIDQTYTRNGAEKDSFMEIENNAATRGVFVPFKRREISVYPESFVSFETLDDFKGALIDHEGHHAKELFWFPQTVNLSVLDLLVSFNSSERMEKKLVRRLAKFELRALANQLKNLPQRPNHTDFYFDNIRYNIDYWNDVLNSSPGIEEFQRA